MKPVKPGFNPKKKPLLPSEQLQQEAHQMEQRLLELREHMKQEKQRRDTETRFKDGSRWRGAVTTKPMKGYAEAVLKAKGRPGSKGKYVSTADLMGGEGSGREKNGEMERERQADSGNEAGSQRRESEIEVFLAGCGLEKYLDAFLSNGIEDLEVVMELTDEHLGGLGLPLGHRIKLLKRVREWKAGKSEMGLNSKEGAAQVASDGFGMFREAVDSFRKGGTITTLPVSPSNTASIQVVQVPKEVLPTPAPPVKPKKTTEGTDAAAVNESLGLMSESARESCWECYRVFSGGFGFIDKRFCSEACVDAFKKKYYLTCECGQVFTRDDGELWGSTWFCSPACPCFPSLPDSPDDEFIPIDPATGDPLR